MNNVKIIYEDNHILVVEKPVNVPVQQDNTNDIDMLRLLKEYLKEKYNKPGNVYLGLVHRLDRPVGGVMVFAKTSKAASRLSEQIRNGEVKKYYLAVVNGILDKKQDTLENYIYKDLTNGNSKIVSKEYPNSKYAKLEYTVLDENKKENISLVRILLYTGRHHQIRIQFSHLGHSLYGDQRYGKQDRNQIALWAYKLQFKHPVKNEILEFISTPYKTGIWNNINI